MRKPLVFLALSSLSISAPKTALVCGAGGFIGHHLVNRLKSEGYWVRGVDLKLPEYATTKADEFHKADLRILSAAKNALSIESGFDEVYQLAADMGGMGFISQHDAEIMHNSALVNLNVIEQCRLSGARKVFFSSSACAYPERNQLDSNNPMCSEESAYPADPDTEYGWEKIFSERLFKAYYRDYGLQVRIARFHNIFGPLGTWRGGREKAPAALCRKVAEAQDGDSIDVWGTGEQTRSFLYIDECLEGVRRMMKSEHDFPVLNIGSEEMISINDLVMMIARVAGKNVSIKNVTGPQGVNGRNSDNKLIQKTLGWQPTTKLEDGIRSLYPWIKNLVEANK